MNELEESNDKLNAKIQKFNDRVEIILKEEGLSFTEFAVWLDITMKNFHELLAKFSVDLDEFGK
jgi:predicted HTH domain antitoxin